MRKLTVIFVLLLFFTQNVKAMQVEFEEISFEELIKRSSVILVVKSIGSKVKGVSITPYYLRMFEPLFRLFHLYPTYGKLIEKYEVLEILKNETNKNISKTINVVEAYWELEYGNCEMWHFEKMMLSPIYDTYLPEFKPNENEERIIFLNYSKKNGFSFAVYYAQEGIKKKKDVETEIKIQNCFN